MTVGMEVLESVDTCQIELVEGILGVDKLNKVGEILWHFGANTGIFEVVGTFSVDFEPAVTVVGTEPWSETPSIRTDMRGGAGRVVV